MDCSLLMASWRDYLRGNGVTMYTLCNAQIGWPTHILAEPTRVDVVEASLVLEIGPVDCELVECVQLAFVCEVCRPRIVACAF